MGGRAALELDEKDVAAVAKAFKFAIEIYEMFEPGGGEPGWAEGAPDPVRERTALDGEIHAYVEANRTGVTPLLTADDAGKNLSSLHYLRVAELGFRAMLLRGRVTPEQIEEDKRKMLDDLESYKPGEGELDDEQMRDWMDVQKGLTMRLAGEIEPEEISREINREFEEAERLAPVVRRIIADRAPYGSCHK